MPLELGTYQWPVQLVKVVFVYVFLFQARRENSGVRLEIYTLGMSGNKTPIQTYRENERMYQYFKLLHSKIPNASLQKKLFK